MNLEDRRAELTANLGRVRARIAAACEAVDRNPREITLVAVTKTFPASDVALLAGLGVRDIGENRDQNAAAKAREVAAAGVSVTWHFVGQLQRNKVRSVVRYAGLVHSVDRPSIADALGKAAAELRDTPLDVLVQVSLDDAPGRGGVVTAELSALAERGAATESLRLRGLMAVAPLGEDPDPAYRRLAEVAAELRGGFPQATVLSAGMSVDLESAVRHGATHLRIGTALLGQRPPLG
ncbi:MAG: YggS family pyridoxal phosphate-dependent enzyme [Micromonosporaceae bacterium]